MAKSRSGVFKKEASELLNRFNASLPFDKKLYHEDIKGSIAHAKMLGKQGILTIKETDAIIDGLKKILFEIESGKFGFAIEDEDIHMAIEKRLGEIAGEEISGRLHTARSRNDQVATDFKLYVQNSLLELAQLTKEFIKTLLGVAKNHTKTLLPGMTHLQHAQPVNFAFHLLAYMYMFKRDIERMQSSYERNNYSPLGSAAFAGTPYPIDRQRSAEKLGFTAPMSNAMDGVSDRDFALEILFNISVLMTHISRLAEELVLWSSIEFGFITLSDEYSTGSSIMPQKKNPDVPELLRGKTGRVYGNLVGLLTVLKGLPLAYNKDMQEDKEGVFDSVETAQISLRIINETIKTMHVNRENMQKACKKGHLSATDLADYLVTHCGIPFREAHFITGKAVAKADELGVDISQMSYLELQKIESKIGKDVEKYISLEASMNARTSKGGTAESATAEQLIEIAEWLKKIKS
ncbi:MAG: argininosuccinate lyase [Campylobacteraceae bacterium]|jgi:argininosuccinate lyase|nr:argininosuccinate lyase [Campylobacteraceae bacterium]